MRKAALQDSVQRDMGGTASPVHLAAPLKGWNTRDPVAAMDPLYALVLDNLFPMQGEVQSRAGYSNWATGANGTVKSLAQHQGPDGTGTLFAATDSGIYDATATGSMGAVVATLTEGFWDSVNFTNSAGTTFLWGCNGVDPVQVFDGATWTAITSVSTPAITGVSSSDVVSPWVFKRRIFVIEKDTMNAWYLPVDSIAGLASKLPIGALFKRGGFLVAGASWTIDGGDGADDLCVFLSSEGEAAVYKGTNPNSAADWSLVGVYFISRPANRRCFQKLGGDVAVLTEVGALPLSKALTSGDLNTAAALSDAIRPTIMAQMALNRDRDGWQIHLHSARNAMILNIPQANGVYIQYVMNTITGAWCSFSAWNAACFITFNGVLYFGLAGGMVGQGWVQDSDGDATQAIVASVQTAFTPFGRAGQVKKLMQFRPLITIDRSITLGWGFVTDYRVGAITSYFDSAVGQFYYWDIALWDVSYWATEPFRLIRWLTASSIEGYAVSVLLQMTTQNANVSWSGTDFLLNSGGLI
jgi:hypothetical protein